MATERERGLAVADRLASEGLEGEAARLRACGEGLVLSCQCCRRVREVPKACRRKWCPTCARAAAAEAVARYTPLVERMRSPLFVTLTQAHAWGDDPAVMLRRMIDGLRSLRRLRWWKQAVRGGVGAVEVSALTMTEAARLGREHSGWHVHWHGLIDCDWLSVTVKAPRRGASKGEIRRAALASQREVEVQWRLCLGGVEGGLFVRRPKAGTLSEVLKYSVSTDSLLDSPLPLAPLIEAMRGAKMRQPWGSVRKALRGIRDEQEATAPHLVCECGAEAWEVARGQAAKPIDHGLRLIQLHEDRRRTRGILDGETRTLQQVAQVKALRSALPGCEALAAQNAEDQRLIRAAKRLPRRPR